MKKTNQPYLITNDTKIPNTHSFSYRSNNYPFNFDILKYSSNYIFKNQAEFQLSPIIKLVDIEDESEINLSDSSINDFINFCQNQRIEIHDQNAIELNFLAKQYEVSSLIKNTECYISSHINDLILQKLSLIKNQQKFESEKYEDMISEKLLDYINDERLILLSIPVIHRILNKYLLKNNKSDDIIPFLFKCLDKHGRNASILFSNIDFGNEKAKYLNILLTKYSKIFDFHFVNHEMTKTLYESQSCIIQKEKIMEKQQKELFDTFNYEMNTIKQEINKIKQEHAAEIQNQKKIEEEKTKHLNNIINEMKNEIKEIKADSLKEIQMQKKTYEDKIAKLINEIDEMKNEMSRFKAENINEIQKHQKIGEKIINQIDEMKIKNEEEINLIKINCCKIGKEEIEQINEQIDHINLLKPIIFQNINIQSFNKLDGDLQMFVINHIITKSKNKILAQIQDLLSYLTKEYHKYNIEFKGSNKIFIPTLSNNDKITCINELNDENNLIGISKDIVNVLSENMVDSAEFISKINQFNQLFLEVQYPSPCFNDIFNKIKNTKVKIILYISESKSENPIFSSNQNIYSIIINDSVNIIDNYSFKKCSSLTQVVIPSSVNSINNSTFSFCHSLKKNSIPTSITSIPNFLFNECSSLTHVTIPSSVVSIGDYAFCGCTSLKNITIPSSVTSLGISAFRECISLLKIEIPSSVTLIKKACFFFCSSLLEVTLPPQLKTIEKNVFKGCSLLKLISIPKSVTSIDIGAFSKCISLYSITIPSSVTFIESYAFSGCSSLETATVPSSITINSNSFPSNTKIIRS